MNSILAILVSVFFPVSVLSLFVSTFTSPTKHPTLRRKAYRIGAASFAIAMVSIAIGVKLDDKKQSDAVRVTANGTDGTNLLSSGSTRQSATEQAPATSDSGQQAIGRGAVDYQHSNRKSVRMMWCSAYVGMVANRIQFMKNDPEFGPIVKQSVDAALSLTVRAAELRQADPTTISDDDQRNILLAGTELASSRFPTTPGALTETNLKAGLGDMANCADEALK